MTPDQQSKLEEMAVDLKCELEKRSSLNTIPLALLLSALTQVHVEASRDYELMKTQVRVADEAFNFHNTIFNKVEAELESEKLSRIKLEEELKLAWKTLAEYDKENEKTEASLKLAVEALKNRYMNEEELKTLSTIQQAHPNL